MFVHVTLTAVRILPLTSTSIKLKRSEWCCRKHSGVTGPFVKVQVNLCRIRSFLDNSVGSSLNERPAVNSASAIDAEMRQCSSSMVDGFVTSCIIRLRNNSNLSMTGMSNLALRASRLLLLQVRQYTSRPSGMLLLAAKQSRGSCVLHDLPGQTLVLTTRSPGCLVQVRGEEDGRCHKLMDGLEKQW